MLATISGAYRIFRRDQPEDCYVGGSVDCRGRKNQHYHDLRKGVHSSKEMQSVVNKFGIEILDFEILEICLPIKQTIQEIEQKWMDLLHPCYNSHPNAASALGWRAPEELKERLKGRPGPNPGVPRPQEVKDKISATKTGVPSTKKGKPSGKKGTTWTEARRLSALKPGGTNKGFKMTEEQRKKISDGRKGKPAQNKGSKWWVSSLTGQFYMSKEPRDPQDQLRFSTRCG